MTDFERIAKERLAVRSWMSEEQAQRYMQYCLPQTPRWTEILWMLIVCALAFGYLSQYQFVDEIVPQYQALEVKAAKYAEVIAHCGNGGSLEFPDRIMDCKRRK